jgi:hypothetical protein
MDTNMYGKTARGTITFEYKLTQTLLDHEVEGEYPDFTREDVIRFFTDQMIDDIVHNIYSDLAPCIEMEIV